MLQDCKRYKAVFLFFALMFGIAGQVALSSPLGDPDAYQVKVFMKNGAKFDAVVKDAELIAFFVENKHLDPKHFDSDKLVTLYYMNGLNGSMGVRMKDLKSITRLVPLSDKELSDVKNVIEKRIDNLREKEKVRLQKLKEKRAEEKKKKEVEKAAKKKREVVEAKKIAEAEKYIWIFRYPSEKGWGPEKKEELYNRAVVVGVYPNDEEQAFIDNFHVWMAQYKAWNKLDDKQRAEISKYGPAVLKKEEKGKSSGGKKDGS